MTRHLDVALIGSLFGATFLSESDLAMSASSNDVPRCSSNLILTSLTVSSAERYAWMGGRLTNVQVRMLAQQSLKDIDEEGDGEGRAGSW